MIGRWLNGLDDASLERIADTPEMVVGQYYEADYDDGMVIHPRFPACLVNTAQGTLDHGLKEGWSRDQRAAIALRFDRLGDHLGAPSGPAPRPIITMIQDRARRILATRKLERMQAVERLDVETIGKLSELAHALDAALQGRPAQPAGGQ